MFFKDGEDEPGFQIEVDNSIGVLDYDNVLVCPLFDTKGNLFGCLHLVNKLNMQTSSTKDEQDVQLICPSISEIINLIDLTSKVVDISIKLYGVMDNLSDKVEIFDKDFQYNLAMDEITYQLNRIDEGMTEVAKTKRESTF